MSALPNWAIHGSGNDLAYFRRQAIVWNNDGVLNRWWTAVDKSKWLWNCRLQNGLRDVAWIEIARLTSVHWIRLDHRPAKGTHITVTSHEPRGDQHERQHQSTALLDLLWGECGGHRWIPITKAKTRPPPPKKKKKKNQNKRKEKQKTKENQKHVVSSSWSHSVLPLFSFSNLKTATRFLIKSSRIMTVITMTNIYCLHSNPVADQWQERTEHPTFENKGGINILFHSFWSALFENFKHLSTHFKTYCVEVFS